jgi:site-specific DNA-methyltransferase (adenine-specific)
MGSGSLTIKPLKLMEYLCNLLAPPPRGIFLDPFAGSGSTLLACQALGIRAVGIELSEEYAEIAAKRISRAAPVPDSQTEMQFECPDDWEEVSL